MKKITGVKRSWDSYVSMKKHKCPECGSILETVDVSKVVDPKSPDKDSVDFKMDYNTYFVGPTKFISKEFECPNCGKHLTVKEMKEHEGLIKDDHLTKEEKKRRKEQNNVKAVIFTVLTGIIVLIIYFLVKTLTKI